MRVYVNFQEAFGEIRRDLAEMGVRVHTKTYQNKDIAGDPDFETLEVCNYMYTVLQPDARDLNPTLPWADLEFSERICGEPVNPGVAWETRAEIWKEFLTVSLVPMSRVGKTEKTARFDYTYSERFNENRLIDALITNLRLDLYSRQHFIAVWHPDDIHKGIGQERIPCTLGYYLQFRDEKLNITYLQRSADLAIHFENDVYLCYRFLRDIAERIAVEPGTFTHWLGSLHVYQKDVEGVF